MASGTESYESLTPDGVAELNAVYRLAEAVARSRSLDEVLDEAVTALRDAVGADRTAVLLVDETGVMRFRAWRGLSEAYRGAVEGHSPWAAEEPDPQPVLVTDASDLELEPALAAAIAREGIRSLAFVPLVHQNRLVGKFMLYRDEPHDWGDREILLARTMASHLASSAVRTRTREQLHESQSQLAVVLANVADGITVTRPGGELLYANEAAARLIGYESTEALLAATDRLDRFELFDEERQPLPLEQLPGRRALAGETSERLVLWRDSATGEERWSIVRASPIRGPDGSVELAVNVFHDVTERKLVEDRARFLGEASEVLAGSLDYQTTLRNVAQLAVPRFADWCVVAIVGEDGSIQPLALRHRDPARTADAEEFARRVPPDPEAEVGLGHVIRTGESELVPEIDETLLDVAAGGNAELREQLRAIAPCSAMTVPLVSRGRVLGGIVFLAAESGRRYGPDDLAAAEDLARRAAAAVDNALLFREAEEAGSRARESLALVDSLFQSAPVGLAFWDTQLRYVRVNDALAEMHGVAAADVVGRHVFDVFPLFAEQLGSVLDRALAGEPTLDVEISGDARCWRASVYPVRADDDRTVGVGAVIAEVTAERHAQARAEAAGRRLEFLSEASQALATTLDYRQTLKQVADLAVPRVAEACHVYVADADGTTLRRAAHAHVDPELDAVIHQLDPVYDVERDTAVPVVAAFRRGEPIHLPTLPSTLDAAARDDAERPLIRLLGSRSAMVLPLVARGRIFGSVAFSSREPGRHGADDLELAVELARRIAVALDRARLYQDVQEAYARLHAVLDQLPIGVLIADARTREIVLGNEAVSRIWRREFVPGRALDAYGGWDAFHADGRLVQPQEWPLARALDSGERILGHTVEFVRGDGTRGTLESSAVPVRGADGDVIAAVAISVDVTERERDARERERAEERLRFLVRASELLAESLDVDATLRSVAELAVPTLAGQCIVDMRGDDGALRCVAVAHVDPAKAELLRHVRAEYPPTQPGHPVQEALRTGEPQLLPALDDAAIDAMAHDERHAAAIRELGNESGIVVPLVARGRMLGAITFGTVAPQPRYTEADVELAAELARRAATAVDNARLYGAAEARAHAAQALAFVDDGVFLLDELETVRLWNPAAEAITGLGAAAAVGVAVGDVLPGWSVLRERIPVAPQPQRGGSRVATLPLELHGEEHWLAISGVRFAGGTVYAFRDVTEERAVERLKSDFVSTVSHELRTPLAAIYGAALTLRRGDLHLEETQRTGLLEVIATEADRLARIVNDILWASRLDAGTVPLTIESCDAAALARQVVEAASQYAPETISLDLDAPDDLPAVAADADKIRQVLTNLLDNAVKYSPDGGHVRLSLEQSDGRLRFAVRDEGLGVPPGEQQRVFEKFYRLDPNLTRGVGGTGLGLYICRELVHRMNGWIWVESDGRNGSTFTVELPLADQRLL